MKCPSTKLLAVVIALVFCTVSASAWNALGHWTIAELAWRQMNPAQRQAASDLLKKHPHYKTMLAVNIPPGVDTNEWAFVNAAIWLDAVRPSRPGDPAKPLSVTKYNIYPHGIGLPFVLPADASRISLKKFVVGKPNAETALADAIARLNNPKTKPADRAVSLCVALHLFGDLHQPLHAAALVTKEEPEGNGGGKFIVLGPDGNPINLHTYWDQLPGMDYSYKGVTALADRLSAAPELNSATLQDYQEHKTVVAWGKESFDAAVSFGYAPNQVQFVHASALKPGKKPAPAIPALSPDYIRGAHEIMQRRIVLAAQRLADTLKQVW